MKSIDRDYLLELDSQRKKIEEEIMEITDQLNADGMPGVDGKLVDDDGFPISGVDLLLVRTLRNRLVHIQNDHKNLMIHVEESMKVYFQTQNENKTVKLEPKIVEFTNEKLIDLTEEKAKITNNLPTIPFSWVKLIADGSPAWEAGLEVDDGIIQFDYLTKGIEKDPLKKISEIVMKNLNQTIKIKVCRQKEEKIQYLDLELVPHKWQGQGVLGCKLSLE